MQSDDIHHFISTLKGLVFASKYYANEKFCFINRSVP